MVEWWSWASWAAYNGGKFTLKVGAKVGIKFALNVCVPGSGPAIEFAEAAKCLYDGDICGCLINTVTGVADIATCGLVSSTKEAMKEGAKATVKQTAKETAKSAGKQATKKVGQDLAKQIAMGTIEGGKDAAVQAAKEAAKGASKEATKQVGQQVAKEIAKGVVGEAVEEAWHEGTKLTFRTVGKTAFFGAVSSGGKEVGKTVWGDVAGGVLNSGLENVFYQAMKQGTKNAAFTFTKDVAKTAAKEEFIKNSYKFLLKDISDAVVKGGINIYYP